MRKQERERSLIGFWLLSEEAVQTITLDVWYPVSGEICQNNFV